MSGKNPVPPISSHPAFTKAVAAWFAALFGLSVLVLPHFALESMLSTVGLSSMLSFFAAPLSPAAHMALCGLGAIFGALVGIVIARRIRGSDASPETSVEIADSEPSIAAAVEAPSPAAKPVDADMPEPAQPQASEPEPAPVDVQVEPAEEAPAPRSIADRLASRVRASENVEPSISEDVAALAADKMAREAEAAAGTQDEVSDETAEAARTDVPQEETANSADALLANMPAIERGDEWKGESQTAAEEHSEKWDSAAAFDEAYTSPGNGEEDKRQDGAVAPDILSAADPLYDDGLEQIEAASHDVEAFEPHKADSFVEEGSIEHTIFDVDTERAGKDYGADYDSAPCDDERQLSQTGDETPDDLPAPEARQSEEPGSASEAQAEAPIHQAARKPDLNQMLSRLESAIGSFEADDETGRAADSDSQPAEQADATSGNDPVVTYLHPETADDAAPEVNARIESKAGDGADDDTEESLRKALDRLTQVNSSA